MSDQQAAPAPDPYATIAQWYDIEHDQHTDDIECYIALLESALNGRGATLEVGSGTGRILAALALAGYHVTGIEPSAEMRQRGQIRLAHLPERVARRVRSVAGSATAPQLAATERFDACLIALNTFAHLTTPSERATALGALHTHLRPGGVLLLDLDLAGPRRLAERPGLLWWQGTWDLTAQALQALQALQATTVTEAYIPREVTHLLTAIPADEPGVLRLIHLYDAVDAAGVVRRSTSVMPLAQLSRGEVALALSSAGFAIEATYGAYDLSAFDDAAPRAIFLARRP